MIPVPINPIICRFFNIKALIYLKEFEFRTKIFAFHHPYKTSTFQDHLQ